MVTPKSPSLTSGQESAVKASERTQNALLKAQEHLYAALRRPQPARERHWAGLVGRELAVALAPRSGITASKSRGTKACMPN